MVKYLTVLIRQVRDVSNRSTAAKFLWFLSMAYIFLWVPDLDLLFVGILHHRSIVTHSILPALILLILGRRAGAAPIAGALIGLAVHLSCDMLSPMVGFAQIWLPAPIKAPLGPLSYLWLFLNASVAFWIARQLAIKAFSLWTGYFLMFSVSVLTAFSYGFINEKSLWSVIITLVVFSISLLGTRRKLENDPVTAKKIEQASGSLKKTKAGIEATLNRVTEVAGNASQVLEQYNRDFELKGKFLGQKFALEANLKCAQHAVEIQRKLDADDALKEQFLKVQEEWGEAERKPVKKNCKLEENLFILSEKQVSTQKIEFLAELQSDHLAFLKNLKETLFRDADVLKKFSEIMFEEQNEDRLQEILNL